MRWVHRYAAGGAAFAAIPLLPITSTGLATLELSMWSTIAKIYGERVNGVSAVAGGAALAILSRGLKEVARGAADLLPLPGFVVRAGVAGLTIEGLGFAVIQFYERRHPGKVFTKR